MRSAAITGMGAVSALGPDLDALREALLAGAHGIAPIERWDASDLEVQIAAHVRAPIEGPEGWTLGERFAVRAAREAWRRAGSRVPMARVALVLGTMGEIGGRVDAYAERVAGALGIEGPRLTVSTACTSGANAIGLGLDLLRTGASDAVIAGGVDELTKALFAGFSALGVLSEAPCAPFSEPPGTTLGEGAGFVVLERGAAAFHLRGYGLSSDAHHATTPDPRGAGVERAIRGALADAGLGPEAIGYVNAHATGTATNDVAEWRAIRAALGEPPVSASKSQLGHAQGAAGALELVAMLLAAEQDLLLPTLRFTSPRARGPVDPIGGDRPRPGRFDAALSASSAFGGANCSLVVARAPDPRPPRARPVYWGGVARAGDHPGPLDARVRGARDLRAIAPHVDPRGTDPGSRAVIAAATLALGPPPRGDARDRLGLILGATRVSPDSLARYRESIDARGHAHVDTAAFARVILSAPAGAATLATGLRGPTSTLHAGAASGLAALVYAAICVAGRDDVDAMLAAGLDEAPDDGPLGATCVRIEPAPTAIRLAGFALAADGPGAARAALAMAGLREPDRTVTPAPGAMPSVASIDAAARAAEGLARAGESALAVAEGEGAAAAVVLVREATR